MSAVWVGGGYITFDRDFSLESVQQGSAFLAQRKEKESEKNGGDIIF